MSTTMLLLIQIPRRLEVYHLQYNQLSLLRVFTGDLKSFFTAGPLSLVVASGPFTQSDSMTYQPLIDLIEKVSTEEPDLLILIGPFIDSTHPFILENSLAETYQDLFTKIVDLIMRPLQR